MEFELREGTLVLIRPVRPTDKAMLAAGWALLSPASQRRRFLGAKPRLTSGDLRYLTEIDGHAHFALVAVLADQPHHVVAVARFVRIPEDPAAAEFAIVVGDAFQGQGLGGHLADLLAERAAAEGLERFTATTEVDNEGAQRLIARIAHHLVYDRRAGALREVSASLAA